MSTKTEEISSIIKEQIKNYSSILKQDDIGHVITVGDGIAQVYGLDKCCMGELLEFCNGTAGMALSLEESCISAALMGTDVGISEGSTVKRTGKVVSVPVGEALLGRWWWFA